MRYVVSYDEPQSQALSGRQIWRTRGAPATRLKADTSLPGLHTYECSCNHYVNAYMQSGPLWTPPYVGRAGVCRGMP